ncbi:DUF4153 domain-containing protein [Pontibacter sp. BT731]|uniref:DUF4153 domain-containing protein n=1 Tax=Pontibacter coccineus TaxID=3063328 RepID=UPI0026E1F456|nr:DUF4153 domain-containing protein [Pontibacter sp. BT731]MDO6390057.1 DUF4153 domain-containing protein [Pontibacter sp. BT731]
MPLLNNVSLRQLWVRAQHTFLRFPMVLLSAVTGTVAVLYLIELEYGSDEKREFLGKLVFVNSAGIILFFTLELLVRRYRLSLQGRFLTWLGGTLFLVLYYFILPEELEAKQVLRHLALVLALHLVASYAMFLNRREENAFWQFNKALFLRVLTSALYTGVLYIGLVIAIVGLNLLFSIKVNDKIYFELWVVLVGVFNTWFFLAGVPLNTRGLERTTDYPKGLKVFTQFVLLPLVTLYLLILYAYLGKIVVQWEWPYGWVSVLVLSFSIAGILSLLLIHPIRNKAGNAWMQTFSRWFYRALFPLTILLALAIWRRISEYGITEERYVVLALAIWLLVTVLYFLFSKSKNIKFIPVTLSLIALLAAFGPVNMFVVSEWSQVSRLRSLLQEHGVMQEGKVVPADKPVSPEARAEISSIVNYLYKNHGFDRLQGWFKTDLKREFEKATADAGSEWARKSVVRDKLLEQMGVEDTDAPRTPVTRNFRFVLNGYESEAKSEVYALAGYDFAAQLLLSQSMSRHDLELGEFPLIVSFDDNTLTFRSEEETLDLDLTGMLEKLQEREGNIRAKSELTSTLRGRELKLQVVVQDINGSQRRKEFTTHEVKLLIFVKIR